MKDGDTYVLARRLHDEMVSRGAWTVEALEQRVKGYYKFSVPGMGRLDELAYERMRETDPGLPEWGDFLDRLKNSELRSVVDG